MWHNPAARDFRSISEPSATATRFHRATPEYAPTPLRELPALARELGLRSLHGKDESLRFGLPAFKILGASWAVHRALERWPKTEVLVTATDGNHGRAVAQVAAERGLGARIYVPAGASPASVCAIESTGADVVRTQGSYDEAVELAKNSLSTTDALIADTTDDPTDPVPGWIIDGYATMFVELPPLDFDAVVVPVGVGSLAAAVVHHFKSANPKHVGAQRIPLLVGVEPVTAAGVGASLAAGRIEMVPGPHLSIMCGLNCGAPSAVAWPDLAGLDVVLGIDDDAASRAVAQLDDAGLRIGETGAASVGALPILREKGVLHSDSRVLVLLTEGGQ